jgi:hypothetical protein
MVYLVIKIETGEIVGVISEKSGVDRQNPVWTRRYTFKEMLK